MIDIETVQEWIGRMGYTSTPESPSMLRVRPEKDETPPLPPFFVQCSENWILLSILPVLTAKEASIEELPRQLLFANRDMRVAKFALGKSDDVILCAELPTESLDYPEFLDAVERMTGYCRHYQSFLRGGDED